PRRAVLGVLSGLDGGPGPPLPAAPDSRPARRGRGRALHSPPARPRRRLVSPGGQSLRRRPHPRGAGLATRHIRSARDRAHGRLVRGKRKARALVPGIVTRPSGAAYGFFFFAAGLAAGLAAGAAIFFAVSAIIMCLEVSAIGICIFDVSLLICIVLWEVSAAAAAGFCSAF